MSLRMPKMPDMSRLAAHLPRRSLAWVSWLAALLALVGLGCNGAGGASQAGAMCTADFVRDRIVRDAPPDGGDIVEPPDVGPCVVKRTPCVATCTAPGCAVSSDVEVTCPEYELASRVLRIAPASTSTYLYAAGERHHHLVQIDGAGTATELEGPDPEKYLWSAYMVADRDDVLHLTAWEEGDTPDTRSGAAWYFRRSAGGWKKELVRNSDDLYLQSPGGLEVGPDGQPHILIRTGPDLQALARRDGDGVWTVGPPDAWRALTLDGAGREVELRDQPVDDTLVVQARRDSATLPFAMPVAGGLYWTVTPATTRALGADAPPFVVASFKDDALHVGWPGAAATPAFTLPGTSQAIDDSYVGKDRDCFGPGAFKETGFANVAFQLARTDDGTAWLAYLLSAYDITYDLGAICPSGLPTNCFCGPKENIVDRTVDELHVVRVRTDGSAPVEALNLSLERQKGGDLGSSEQLLQMRAHGNRVAIVARVEAGGGRPKLRVVTLDANSP